MKSWTKRWCALALCLALWGPVAKADEGASAWGWVQAIVEAIEEIVLGPPAEEGDASTNPASVGPELGELFPPGG